MQLQGPWAPFDRSPFNLFFFLSFKQLNIFLILRVREHFLPLKKVLTALKIKQVWLFKIYIQTQTKKSKAHQGFKLKSNDCRRRTKKKTHHQSSGKLTNVNEEKHSLHFRETENERTFAFIPKKMGVKKNQICSCSNLLFKIQNALNRSKMFVVQILNHRMWINNKVTSTSF